MKTEIVKWTIFKVVHKGFWDKKTVVYMRSSTNITVSKTLEGHWTKKEIEQYFAGVDNYTF